MPKNETHQRLLKQFDYDHLPPELQALSQPFHDLAAAMVHHADPDSGAGPLHPADVTVALRKLLEAKDAYVRAAIS